MFHMFEFLLPPLSLLFCTTLFWQIFFHRVCQVNTQHSNLHVLFKHKILQVLCGVEKCCMPCISKQQLSSMCYHMPSSHVSTPPMAMTLWNHCASPTLSWKLTCTYLTSKKLFIKIEQAGDFLFQCIFSRLSKYFELPYCFCIPAFFPACPLQT